MNFLVVDGNSILNRAFYGIRGLATKDGRFTNGIYGFLTMFEKIKRDTQPDAVAIAFDMRAPTFRHKAYDGYKAQRKGMPDELAEQMLPLKDLLIALGYNIVSCEGYEADDIIGTLAKSCENHGHKCFIATGDRDSLQLISENVTVNLASTKETIVYDPDKIQEEYGVSPAQLIDIKAIQGDSSDNIPGVSGIGQKGASDLIKRFKDLDYIYENIETIDIKSAIRQKLINGKESAYMSRMLGTVCTSVPIDTDPNSYSIHPADTVKAAALLRDLEMFSLLDKLHLNSAVIPSENLNTDAVETKTFNVKQLRFESYKKSEKKTLIVLPVYSGGDLKNIIFADGYDIFISDDTDLFFGILENPDIKKKTYNVKHLYAYAIKNNIKPQNMCFDLQLAAYVLNPSSSDYSLNRLYQEYGIVLPELNFEDTVSIDADTVREYAGILELTEKLELAIVKNNQQKLLYEIEIPLAYVLSKMEHIGFCIDADGIKAYGQQLGSEIGMLEQEIWHSAGCEFNINSPMQLGAALFDNLKLPAKKKTKTGYSTNAEVLESLYHEHPVIPLIIKYRTLSKLKSTYCDGFLKVVADDGRIYSKFNQTETRTGRISSTEPNMQNIPVRSETGRQLRKYFRAKEGFILVDADYSQIELRVLAHMSDDHNMLQAFRDNLDIHSITASQVFNMPPDLVTSIMRSRAKAVNFGIVYGIGAFSLAKDIGVSHKDASKYINSYLTHYSGVDSYMKNAVEQAKEKGYSETLFGRKRYLPELASSNYQTRAFGERVARNMPIQGTAADIIKIAMLRVDRRLEQENMRARLILQVHDELIVEAPQEEAIAVAMILQEEMENAAALNVPLVADASMGVTWYDAKL